VGAREGEWRLCGWPSLSFLSIFSLLLGRLTVAYVPDLAFARRLPPCTVHPLAGTACVVRVLQWGMIHGRTQTSCFGVDLVTHATNNMSRTATAKRPYLYRAQRAGRLPSARHVGWGVQRVELAGNRVNPPTPPPIGRSVDANGSVGPAGEPATCAGRVSGGNCDDGGGSVALRRRTPPRPCCVAMSTTIRSQSRTRQV